MNRGKAVTVGILVLALSAAAYAWWHQRQRGDRAVHYWGGRQAYAIRHGERVEWWTIRPARPEDAVGSLAIDGLPWVVTRQTDITHAQGLVHARQALIEDATFVWDAPPRDQPQWTDALVFHGVGVQVVVLFDAQRKLVRALARPAPAVLTPKAAAGFDTLLDEQGR
jgi:hypothetical protein